MEIKRSDHFTYRRLFRFVIPSIVMMIFTSIYGVAALLLSGMLAGLFVGYDAELYDMTKKGFAIYSLSFVVMGLNIYASLFFTALNNGLISALISFRILKYSTGNNICTKKHI